MGAGVSNVVDLENGVATAERRIQVEELIYKGNKVMILAWNTLVFGGHGMSSGAV